MSDKLARQSWSLTPSSVTEAMEYAKLIADSSIVPKDFKGRAGDVLVAVQMGSELGLSPMAALQSIAVINGRPCLYGDGALAVVLASPHYGGHEETFDEKTNTATATFLRKNNAKPIIRTFSEADAKKARLWGKPGPWTDYTRRMLQMRARSWAIRDGFSDVLRGISIVEEVEDIQPPAEPVMPKRKSELLEEAKVDHAVAVEQYLVGEVIDAAFEEIREPLPTQPEQPPFTEDEKVKQVEEIFGGTVVPDDAHLIKNVVVLGTGKYQNRPWTKYEITTHRNEHFITFSSTVAEDAKIAKDKGFPVWLEMKQNGKGQTAISKITDSKPKGE